MSKMESEVLVDALPYFDQGYEEPGVREAAQSLVDEETRRYRPTKNYLEHLPSANYTAFESNIMKQEFERLQARTPMEVLSMKRYELPQPPAGKVTDFSSWQDSVNNSYAQLEHQALRIMNLNLLSNYGTEVWKQHNDTLQHMLRSAQKQVAALKKEIQDINWNRKSEQTSVGGNLKELEERWVFLVGKNYEIESACMALEQELQAIENSENQP